MLRVRSNSINKEKAKESNDLENVGPTMLKKNVLYYRTYKSFGYSNQNATVLEGGEQLQNNQTVPQDIS